MVPTLVQGRAQVVAAGYHAMLVLPSDLPLLTAADILELLRAHPRPTGVTLVPAAHGGGTNALCCSPPALIDLHFGEDSFGRHFAAAQGQDAPTVVLEPERIALDIDDAADIAAFLEHPRSTRTGVFLCALDIGAWLVEMAARDEQAVSGTPRAAALGACAQ